MRFTSPSPSTMSHGVHLQRKVLPSSRSTPRPLHHHHPKHTRSPLSSISSSLPYDAGTHMAICPSAGVSSQAPFIYLLVCLVSSHLKHLLPDCPDRAQHLALFLHARSLLSAGVRMNTIGPYLSQQLLLRDVRPIVDTLVTQCATVSTTIFTDGSRDLQHTDELPLNGPANTWPLGEILAMRHDLQHSRIFNS